MAQMNLLPRLQQATWLCAMYIVYLCFYCVFTAPPPTWSVVTLNKHTLNYVIKHWADRNLKNTDMGSLFKRTPWDQVMKQDTWWFLSCQLILHFKGEYHQTCFLINEHKSECMRSKWGAQWKLTGFPNTANSWGQAEDLLCWIAVAAARFGHHCFKIKPEFNGALKKKTSKERAN